MLRSASFWLYPRRGYGSISSRFFHSGWDAIWCSLSLSASLLVHSGRHQLDSDADFSANLAQPKPWHLASSPVPTLLSEERRQQPWIIATTAGEEDGFHNSAGSRCDATTEYG